MDISNYKRVRDQWVQKRASGQSDASEMNAFLQLLKQAVNEYVMTSDDNDFDRENRLKNIQSMIQNTFVIIGGKQVTAFVQILFKQVFQKWYKEYLQENQKLKLGQTKGSKQKNALLDRIATIIEVPRKFYASDWDKLVVQTGKNIDTAPSLVRPSIRGTDALQIKSGKLTEEQKQKQQKTKRDQDKADEDADREEANEQDKLIKAGREEEAYGFRPVEQIKVSKYNIEDPSWILSTPTNVQFETMFTQAQQLNSQVIIEDYLMVRNEAAFWINEFFNHLLVPCNFAAPNSVINNKLYIVRIMYNLLKMAFAINTKRDDKQFVQVALKTYLFTFHQWNEYTSIYFPRNTQMSPTVLQHLTVYFVSSPIVENAKRKVIKLPDAQPYLSIGDYELTAKSVKRVLGISDRGELDDNNINAFVTLLQRVTPLELKVQYQTSFVYKVIMDRGPVEAAKKFPKYIPNQVDIVVIPIHDPKRRHWYLTVINGQKRQIQLYDSLYPNDCSIDVPRIKQWVVEWVRLGKNATEALPDMNEWQVVSMLTSQMQPDVYACGIYTCLFAQSVVQPFDVNKLYKVPVSRLREFVAESLLSESAIVATFTTPVTIK